MSGLRKTIDGKVIIKMHKGKIEKNQFVSNGVTMEIIKGLIKKYVYKAVLIIRELYKNTAKYKRQSLLYAAIFNSLLLSSN